ncbi:MAG: hypothetical protein U9Q81_18110 [Pseudomonadota bacterium]|nr:hypothetical protein [Pseudomonadota bacterium]
MPRYYVRETFFRPEEHARQQTALPAAIHNALQLLLVRSGADSLFIPIRSMQFQAVVQREEVIFVDNHGGYAHQDGEGGRLIRIAWRPAPAAMRESLSGPVPYEILYYFPDLKDTQRRLIGEVQPVLRQILERQREKDIQTVERRVVPFRRGG